MSVAVTGSATTYALAGGGESSSTFSVTVPSGQSKLVVGVAVHYNTRTCSGVTFGGVALTRRIVNTPAWDTEVSLWTLDNPTASTANVVATYSGAMRGGCVALCVAGDAAGAPSDTDAVSGTSGALSLTLTSATGGLVLDLYSCDAGDTVTIAATAGQTELANFIGSAGVGKRVGMSSKPGAASVTTTWTPTGSIGEEGMVSMALDAAASGPGVGALGFRETRGRQKSHSGR